MGFRLVGLFFDIQLACIHIGKAQKMRYFMQSTCFDGARRHGGGRSARHSAGVGFVVLFLFLFFFQVIRVGWDGMNGW